MLIKITLTLLVICCANYFLSRNYLHSINPLVSINPRIANNRENIIIIWWYLSRILLGVSATAAALSIIWTGLY